MIPNRLFAEDGLDGLGGVDGDGLSEAVSISKLAEYLE